MSQKQAAILVLCVIDSICVLACRGTSSSAAAEPAMAREIAMPVDSSVGDRMSEVTAIFMALDGRRSSFRLEVADTPLRRERGLMHRKSMETDRGMVFVFPGDDVQTFWMKNTLVPLDMLFIDLNGRVAGVVENARPMTLDARSIGQPTRFVVELNGRTAQSRGIAAGATVVFDPPLKPADR
jgi:uncharacterized membrane protein (UPF0127 family)